MSDRWARVWFGATALVGFAAVAVQLGLYGSHPVPHFGSAAARTVNELFFFTIESNLLVAVTALLLAIRRDRASTAFGVLWRAAIVGIVITAVVYHVVLARLAHLTGWWVVTDLFLHTVVPVLAVAGWVFAGPRRLASWRTALLSLVYPALFLAVTLIRGRLIDWYPYPFLDVAHLGYARVLLNSLVIAVLFVLVALGVNGVDRWLARRGRGTAGDEVAPYRELKTSAR
ncbi:Pr6Pr family membrane protein [Planosporangium thailandense]|uniref:Pr6Pr family membrane protein n=1 Tax=Planosporangium thailandense TaxID=765197 RepID=A0ABX0Y1B1_9ACTN|nr:Pr6Pr family membrane protein [Planosporangium thailandense]NJC72150.1 Pr6Pr family membrane protein [Planosporangium thailandense]